MNNLTKALLTGLAGAVIVFFLAGSTRKKVPRTYTGKLSVSILHDSNSRSFSLADVKVLLERRIQAAGYKCSIQEQNGSAAITIHQLTDTLLPALLITKNIHVQIRELYTFNDPGIINMLRAPSLQSGLLPSPDENRVEEKIVPDTSLLSLTGKREPVKPTTAADEKKSFTNILKINGYATPGPGGAAMFASEIGQISKRDTAALRTMLFQPDVALRTPSDLELHYGAVYSKKKQDSVLSLYFIRTNGNPGKAIIENEDISSAVVSAGYENRPQITLHFTTGGSAKWEQLTRRCTGKYLAILIDDEVITAPLVQGAIEGGSSAITGNYSYAEAKSIAIGLQSPRIPFQLVIEKQSFQAGKTAFDYLRYLLWPLLGFLVSGTLGFYVFKSLKTT